MRLGCLSPRENGSWIFDRAKGGAGEQQPGKQERLDALRMSPRSMGAGLSPGWGTTRRGSGERCVLTFYCVCIYYMYVCMCVYRIIP